MADLDLVDLTYLRHRLRVFWLHGETYETAKSFWNTLLPCNNKTPRFPRLRSRAYRKMENRGWINLANLDKDPDKLPVTARQIFEKLRSHGAVSLDGRRLPDIQMVLKPYDIDRGIDAVSSLEKAVPACVPYVVLKKNTNPIADDVNDFSSADIDWLTRYSRSWMVWKVFLPEKDQRSDSERERTKRLSAPYTLGDNEEESKAQRLSPGSVQPEAAQNFRST